MSYTIRYRGTVHTVEVLEDGQRVITPPLPPEYEASQKRNLREMCDSRTAPGTRTDTSFHAGRGTLLEQMDGDVNWTKYLVQQAKKQGYTPGANDVYLGQMADKDGDPKAWFKPGEGRDELKRRAIKHGKGIDMPGLYVAPRPYVPKKRPALNPRIAKQIARDYRTRGEDNGMSDKELIKHVTEKHGRKKKS